MEILFLFILSFFCLSLYFLKPCFPKQLPPGPKPLPIFGNILHLTSKPHRALAELSKRYGPLMSLKLGNISTLIVSSPDMAREVLQKHDLAFSSRHIPDAVRALDHHLYSMVWLPVSPQWRNLRKLVAIKLFSTKCLDESQSLRQQKVLELLEYVGECCRNGQAVDVGRVGFTTTLNLLSNTLFSVDLASYDSASSQEFKEIVWSVMKCAGRSNLADLFPVLAYFDPCGLRREVTTQFSKLFDVFDDLISERLSKDPTNPSVDADVLETLLHMSKQDGSNLSLLDIKHLLVDLFVAGTDTSSNTLEWAMTELLRNPSKMAKAQAELNQVLSKHTSIQESDIEKLPYLQAIVKETLRLHPPAPLLLPHKAQEGVKLGNYHIPRGTQVLVNLWAIGQNLETWKNPSEFLPERFLDTIDIDMRGRDFELIPFGAGRRICPGMPLAYRMVHIMLATLIHEYDWKLENGMMGEEIDMNEKFGVTLQKANPLMVIPVPK